MKRLNIIGWEKVVQQLDGRRFELQYGVDKSLCYRLSLKSVRTNHYYQLSIDKEAREDGSYQVWIWDMNKNHSYPLSISTYEFKTKELFARFLDSIIDVLDTGGFSGNKGNSTTQPN